MLCLYSSFNNTGCLKNLWKACFKGLLLGNELETNQASEVKMSKSILVLVSHVESPRTRCNRNYEFRRRMRKKYLTVQKIQKDIQIQYSFIKDTLFLSCALLQRNILFLVYLGLKIGFIMIKEASIRKVEGPWRQLKVYF